ncbi:Co/Zn/Cd efflux system component [Paraburkholderia graminis]|uniref:cation transporter n=1 Tax=Paraburkholderia graminis TaxID=60548 RepID=UPI00285C41EB|nr:cation transporter [Paraburkholderia graminis]MDR6470191.1 Co/Zn/Cd efflux system component [Paraburkholderia graminis]
MQPNASSAMTQPLLRRVVAGVALANAAYFFVEFFVARKIGSVSLFADSIDFLEDAALNFLIFAALGWSVRNRARAGMVLAAILLVPALALLWTAWQKFNAPTPPEPWLLSGTGLGALAVNLACAVVLARFRHHSGSLTRAASCRPAMTHSRTSRSFSRDWSHCYGARAGPIFWSDSESPLSMQMPRRKFGSLRGTSIGLRRHERAAPQLIRHTTRFANTSLNTGIAEKTFGHPA